MGKFKLTHDEINQAYDAALKWQPGQQAMESGAPQGSDREAIDKVMQAAQAMRQRTNPLVR